MNMGYLKKCILCLVLLSLSPSIFADNYADDIHWFQRWFDSQTSEPWASFTKCPALNARVRKSDSCATQGGDFLANRGRNPGHAHFALDIESKIQSNSNVYAIGNGRVGLVAKGWPGLGNVIFIEHTINGQAYYSLYAHLDQISVRKGSTVAAGENIGTIGYSGNAACLLKKNLPQHVHFAVYKGLLANESIMPRRIHMWKDLKKMKEYFGVKGFGPLDPTPWLSNNGCV